MGTLFHAIFSGASMGILVLATAAFFVRLLFGSWRDDVAKGADIVATTAAMVGIVFAIVAGLTGYYGTWGVEAVRDSMVAQNKTLVSFALLASYGLFVFLRLRTGAVFWRSLPLKLWSAALVLFGFVNLVLVGSMGGSATLKGTVLDPVLWALNINRYVSLSWGIWLNAGLIVAMVLVVAFVLMRRPAARTKAGDPPPTRKAA
jgi:hypothetical protein